MQSMAHETTAHDTVEQDRLPSWVSLFIASVFGALGGLALALLLFGFAHRDDFSSLIDDLLPVQRTEIVEENAVSSEPATNFSASEYLDAYVWTTRVRLDDLGLGRMLKVSSTEDGKILIKGTLLGAHAGRYSIFKGWFQSRTTYPPLIDEVEFLKLSGVFPKVVSVWLGDNPLVHLDNGKNARIGNTLGDGWKIVEIGRLAMMLERDGTVIELAYNDS